MSNEQNFTVFAGEDKLLHVTITEDDDVTPEDITDWTLDATFRPDVEGSTPILTKAAVVTDALGGECEVTLTRAETLPWMPYKRLVFALRRTNAGASTVVADGVVTVEEP